MAQLWKGAAVAAAIDCRTESTVRALIEKGITPTLEVIRCGQRPDDLSYERAILKRAQALQIAVKQTVLPSDAGKEAVLAALDQANGDSAIHGVLLLRPLPAHLRLWQEEIENRLDPRKDVDGMTALSAAGVFLGKELGYPPCTAQACVEMLEHYGVDCEGKQAVIIGRSAVVGKPTAMLLLQRNATVTICHTRTRDLSAAARQADILVTAAGSLRSVTADFVRPGQILLDVSVNVDKAAGGIAGDADFAAVDPVVAAITPVPGGVGAVTTAVLLSHTAAAAKRSLEQWLRCGRAGDDAGEPHLQGGDTMRSTELSACRRISDCLGRT